MARDVYSIKQLSERDLFRLLWKNILTGLTENYMFKNNCRFYDFHPASQASFYHLFCFGRLMYFRQTLFCTAAGGHFWSLDLPVRHWKDRGTIRCRRRGCIGIYASTSRYKTLNLTNSPLWGCWTVKVIGYYAGGHNPLKSSVSSSKVQCSPPPPRAPL